ncbi:hypothetical protein I204_06230 [Kwoniella mangroviensis CBS 8886]|nr:hypothetical protein I204_06230 [Kwoniella mangroviensis CBS 8886]
MTYIQSPRSTPASCSSSPGASPSTSYSPIRHSPLSQPPISAISRTPSPTSYVGNGVKPIPTPSRRASQPTSRGSLSPLTSLVSPSPRYMNGGTSPTSSFHTPTHDVVHSNDQSPSASPSPSRRLSRSQPLLGSYHLSLLHSRMSSAHQPHQLTNEFSISLVSIGKGKSCAAHLRYPSAVEIPFSAVYYDLEDPEAIGMMPTKSTQSQCQSPWTGGVDLEKYYYDSFSNTRPYPDPHSHPHSHVLDAPTRKNEPPSFPGYQVSPVGQLQILIKSSNSPIKVFLIPYDLRKVSIGGRLLVREKAYCKTRDSIGENGGKGVLKYAIQLQFVCILPASSPVNRTTQSTSLPSTPSHAHDGKSYYVSKSMKVVFVSTPPDSREMMDVERTDEIVEPPTTPTSSGNKRRRSSLAFSPGSLGKTSEEWEMVRMKWFARRDMEMDRSEVDAQLDKVDRGDSTRSKRDSDMGLVLEKPRMIRKPSLISTTSPFSSSVSTDVPKSAISPLPILSPLPIRPTTSTLHKSRPSTPTSPRPISPHLNGSGPPLIWSPTGQRRMRREDGLEEVELSERLRKMGVGVNKEE